MKKSMNILLTIILTLTALLVSVTTALAAQTAANPSKNLFTISILRLFGEFSVLPRQRLLADFLRICVVGASLHNEKFAQKSIKSEMVNRFLQK